MIATAWVLLIAGMCSLAYGTYGTFKEKASNKEDNARTQAQKLAKNAGINLSNGKRSEQEFRSFMNDAIKLGYISKDKATHQEAMKAYNKLLYNNWDFTELSNSENDALANLCTELYEKYPEFKSSWDKTYSELDENLKQQFLNGAVQKGVPIPAPAYLDTSFDRYQKEVEPLKFYTNKELADIYNIDYDYEHIKKDLDDAAEAQVAYRNWESDLLANAAERDNTQTVTDYLDAIRNVKSNAVINGVSSGARAAAEVLAANEAMRNKALNNMDVATQRMKTINDALLQRAETGLKAAQTYDSLSQILSNAGVSLYGNDVNRLGQDLLTNANILSADENLRSNRAAQNALMAAIYNNVNAQNQAAVSGMQDPYRYFRDVTMKAYNGDFNAAIDDYINLAYQQNSGYKDQMAKWGQGDD